MNPIKITSIYGKTIEFADCALQEARVQVTLRDSGGEFVRNAIFPVTEMQRVAAEFTPAPIKSDKGVFFLLRQKVSKPAKVKICFAPESGIVDGKEYTSRAKAQRSARNLNDQYGSKWNYFVVEKETV